MEEVNKQLSMAEQPEQENEISLADIWNIIRRRYGLILIITAICLIGGYFFSSKQIPYYRSTATLLVQSPSGVGSQDMYSDYWYSERWAMTYAEMFKGDPVLEETKNRIVYPSLTMAQIRNALSVEVVKNTLLMRITATNEDNKVAKKIVDTVSVVFIEKISEMYRSNIEASTTTLKKQIEKLNQEIEILDAQIGSTGLSIVEKQQKQDELKNKWELKGILDEQLQTQLSNEMQLTPAIKIYQEGNLPVNPINTKMVMILLISLALGLFLGFLLAFLLEYFDDTIKSEEDLKKASHGRVLGLIPHFDSKTEGYYYNRYSYRAGKKAVSN
ncbi:hypothetical protein LLG10_00445 [bacterium]|nr:hypothetical protein [bacterium]